MRRMALIVVVLIGVSVSSSSGVAGGSIDNVLLLQDTSRSSQQAQDWLQRSYGLAMDRDVSQLDRIRLLNNIVIAAPDIAPKQKVIEWATTLISLANDLEKQKIQGVMPTGVTLTDPLAFKKNAVVAISKVNSKLAMAKFSELGPQPANDEGEKPEDIRAFGARVVFLNYFRDYKRNSLSEIEAASENLTKDGSYPFHAISLIIIELATEEGAASADANNLFDNALAHYTCPAKVTNQDNDFFTFLQNIKPVLSDANVKRAAAAFRDHLTKSECGIKLPDTYVAAIETPEGTVQVNDMRRALLFRAFPLIDEIDHDNIGQLLMDKDSELKKATTINHFLNARINGNPSPQDRANAEAEALQTALKQAIIKARESSPEAALEMVTSLNNQGNKIVQTASILPSLSQKDLQRTKQLYDQTLDGFNALEDGPQKTQARVWMAETAYQTDDPNNFRNLATATFSEGLRAFQESPKTWAVDRRPGYAELSEFVKFASAHGIAWPLDEMEQVPDKNLKAALLMCAAIGRAHI